MKISWGEDSKKLKNLLDTLKDKAQTFAEWGVNSNHRVPKILMGTWTGNAIVGHIHIGLCRSDLIGENSKRIIIQ